jgi:hypothetical protein
MTIVLYTHLVLQRSMTTREELKKKFIVNQEAYAQDRIPEFVERALRFCTVTSQGMVFIKRRDMTVKDRIIIVLIGRFLASQLETKIRPQVPAEELAGMLSVDLQQIFARLSDLCDAHIALRTEKGTYSIAPFCLELCLNEIEEKYKNEQESTLAETVKRPRAHRKQSVQTPQIDNLENIDKNKYAFVYDIKSLEFRCLSALKMARDELRQDWLTTNQILDVLRERFRLKVYLASISNAMRIGERRGYADSESVKGHSTARRYRLMHKGELYLDAEIKKRNPEQHNHA